jgi:hypothetical protein
LAIRVFPFSFHRSLRDLFQISAMPRFLLPYSLSFIYPALHFFSCRLSILYSFIFSSFNPSLNLHIPPFYPHFSPSRKASKTLSTLSQNKTSSTLLIRIKQLNNMFHTRQQRSLSPARSISDDDLPNVYVPFLLPLSVSPPHTYPLPSPSLRPLLR